ncbi:MAG TPA: hypothetical protein PLQ12_10760, partial [Candidatus Defluviicoccus seviourii]|nr:hypothetical protein [Candidatus Defluviicoccus seviourii]
MLQAPIASPQLDPMAAVGTPPKTTSLNDPAAALASPRGAEVAAGITVDTQSSGESHALGADGTVLPLGPGDRLNADDIVETGAGARLMLRTTDGAQVIAGPESRLLITPENGQTAGGTTAGGVTPLAGRFLIHLPAAADGSERPFVLDTTAGEIRL